MQVEIKVALNFILSFLYEKLPRRRVNLFGDELQKYLILKFFPNSSSSSSNTEASEKNCLNINFKSFNGSDIIDPCLIAAANTSAINIHEVLQCLPDRLKLFIEPDLVYYALLSKNQDEIDEMKIIFDNKSQQSSQVVTNLVADTAASNLMNFDFLLNQISSMSVKENSPTNPITTNTTPTTTTTTTAAKQIFTTAAFAQTKFGSTKKKNSNYLNDPSHKPSSSLSVSSAYSKPQTNPKIHSNEFSAYIKVQHSNLLKSNLETKEFDKQKQSLISNLLFKAIKLADYNNNNTTTTTTTNTIQQLDGGNNDWTYNNNNNYSMDLLKQQQQQQQKQQSPVNSSASSSSSLDFTMNSSSLAFDELEENMINNYFNPIALNQATPAINSNFSMPYQQTKNQLLNLNDLKFNFDNQD